MTTTNLKTLKTNNLISRTIYTDSLIIKPTSTSLKWAKQTVSDTNIRLYSGLNYVRKLKTNNITDIIIANTSFLIGTDSSTFYYVLHEDCKNFDVGLKDNNNNIITHTFTALEDDIITFNLSTTTLILTHKRDNKFTIETKIIDITSNNGNNLTPFISTNLAFGCQINYTQQLTTSMINNKLTFNSNVPILFSSSTEIPITPTEDNHIANKAYVDANSGSSSVGYFPINDLTDVTITSPAEDNIIKYNPNTNIWENKLPYSYAFGDQASYIGNDPSGSIPVYSDTFYNRTIWWGNFYAAYENVGWGVSSSGGFMNYFIIPETGVYEVTSQVLVQPISGQDRHVQYCLCNNASQAIIAQSDAFIPSSSGTPDLKRQTITITTIKNFTASDQLCFTIQSDQTNYHGTDGLLISNVSIHNYYSFKQLDI